MEGIIIGNISNTYKIETTEKIYVAYARGKFKNRDIKPLVGDRVEIEVTDEEKNEAIIEEIKTDTGIASTIPILSIRKRQISYGI